MNAAVRRRRSASVDGPNPIDVHVGARVRLRRTFMSMSQEKLGDAIGLTFQQIQKYERGANRIGSSRLFELSTALDVPVSFFFDDMPPEIESPTPCRPPGLAEAPISTFEMDPLARQEILDLVRTYYQIGNLAVRRRMFDLSKSLGKTQAK
jgi:transcriptional regulator with XRE-family HTH domain